MLLQLHDYIKKEKTVSDQQLSREFGMDISALEPMLAIWLQKDKIQRIQSTSCRSACFKCKRPPIYYEFKL